MSTSPLVIDRRLAIQLLHAAQIAAPASIEGVVLAEHGEPSRYADQSRTGGDVPWARVYSNPAAPAVPDATQRASHTLVLMISLDTKGVLALRAWTPDGERVIAIRD